MTKKLTPEEQTLLKQEVERVKKDINISFDEYLKFFVGLPSKNEYEKYIAEIEKINLYKYPDLFSNKMNLKTKKSKKKIEPILDIETEIEPLASTNSLYMNLYKHLQIYKYKRNLYSSTFYDALVATDLEASKETKEEKLLEELKKYFEKGDSK